MIPGYFTSLAVLHIAMLVGQLIFAGVVAFLMFTHAFPPALSDALYFKVGVIALAIGCLAVSQHLYNKRVNDAQIGQTTDERLTSYRSAFLIRGALLEAPSIFAIIVFMLTGNVIYLAVSGALMLWFALQYPFRNKVLSALAIDELSLLDGQGDRF